MLVAVWDILDVYHNCEEGREQKIMDSLLDEIMKLDTLMEEGYRGARPNIKLLQYKPDTQLSFSIH